MVRVGETLKEDIDLTTGQLLLTFRSLVLFRDLSPIPVRVRVGTLSWCPNGLRAFCLLGNLHGGQQRGDDLINVPELERGYRSDVRKSSISS